MSHEFDLLKKTKKKTITLNVDPVVYDQVKAKAKKLGLKINAVVEHGMKLFLEDDK